MSASDGLPWSQACERNKAPILTALRQIFATTDVVLEIGSGTGQHAIHFATELPQLRWQPSDVKGQQATLGARVEKANLANLAQPMVLDVCQTPWPLERVGGVFAANVAHIMAWTGVEALFNGVSQILSPDGTFALYGPFNENGTFTSPGNEALDAWARQTFPGGGLRDLESMIALAEFHQLTALAPQTMPANNLMLTFSKTPP